MKIKLLFAFLIVFVFSANQKIIAQTTYHKMLDATKTEWYIFNAMIAVKPIGSHVDPNRTNNWIQLYEGRYSAKNDTIIGIKNYKKFFHDYYSPGFNANELMGFIREDTLTQQVFFMETNGITEKKLYDFSLNVGDTVTIDFQNASSQFPPGTYAVYNVDSVLTNVGYRKQITFNGGAADLVWIESIGSVIHPIYIYNTWNDYGQFSWGSGSCNYPYDIGLACKYSNTTKYYQSCTYTLALSNPCIYKYDSCNYYNNCSQVKELESNLKFKMNPNPTFDKTIIEIKLEHDDQITIEVIDVFGRKVKDLPNQKVSTGDNKISLDVSELKNGHYIIKTSGNSFVKNASLIISR